MPNHRVADRSALLAQFSQRSADSCTSTAATTKDRRAHGRTTNNYARLRTISAPEIRPLDLRHAGELGAGTGELDAAVLQHIGVVREPQRGRGHLLDQDDRRSLLAQRADRARDLLHQQRREPHRRLVHEDDARLRHQASGDRQHLLLAARKRARKLAAPFTQDRETRHLALHQLGDAHAVARQPGVAALAVE
jgi:hypothetical protein